MFHKDNVEVVDNGLARKENNRLNSFSGRNCDSPKTKRGYAGTWDGGKVRNKYSQHTGQNCPLDSHAQFDQQ